MRLGIIGAGGHAKVITDTLRRKNRHAEFIYFSADSTPALIEDAPSYEDNEQQILNFRSAVEGWHVAIGSPVIRKRKIEWLLANGFPLINAIHDRGVCSEQSVIGEGSSLMAGAVINPYVVIGQGCIINTSSSVDHDCKIASFVNIGPGSRLSGSVNIGELCELGTGTIVLPGVTIGRHCIIGAGSVVLSDIPDHSLAYGVPARVIRQLDGGSFVSSVPPHNDGRVE